MGETSSVAIQMKATERYFPEVLFIFRDIFNAVEGGSNFFVTLVRKKTESVAAVALFFCPVQGFIIIIIF